MRETAREQTTTPLEQRFERVVTPFQEFIKDQTISSIILILCTFVALAIANSPLAASYERLLHMPLGFTAGEHVFSMSLHHWINEGLMSLFFFLIGLEIKRELLVGELRDPRRSIPVVAAALGGMLVPAAIFTWLNAGSVHAHGWGIPMATDTAFAVGILALLGGRIPAATFAFLTALAIMDDLGAILVIALFYSDQIDLGALGFVAGMICLLILCNVLGIRRPIVYFLGGVLVWAGMLDSGVHATLAGLLVAAVVPARPKRASHWFLQHTRRLVNRFREIEQNKALRQPILGEEEQHAVVEALQDVAEKSTTPLRRWERALEHPIGFVVMPVFALTNAGIPLHAGTLQCLWTDTLAIGIFLGLVAGKAVGIPLFAWIVLRLRIGQLPAGVNMNHIVGIGLLGGMGFTMSIFIANLGFDTSPQALQEAKSGILLASLVAGVAGYLWLRFTSRRHARQRRS
jgi:NhaA family Na+:H+ antiporter